MSIPGDPGQGRNSNERTDAWLQQPLTVAQAATYLNVNERYVRLLVSERRIAYLKLGRLIRFRPQDLDAYLASCLVPTPEPRRRTRG